VNEERALIARLEGAGPEELAEIIARPSARDEKVLRAHLGDETFERMHGLAIRTRIARAVPKSRGNIVVIHGIMGGELTSIDRSGDADQIWLNLPRLLMGWLGRLELDQTGRAERDTEHDVRASGILKRTYGEILLSLSRNWNVRAFWFDWRKELSLAADLLDFQIGPWFGDGAPVHIVAHSMGGLVARTFIERHPERWNGMRGSNGGKDWLGGRLVMLGTPNHGSFTIVQVITGLEKMVRRLEQLDLRNDMRAVLRIVNSFPGSLEMLPSPLGRWKNMEPLYKAETYGDLNLSQAHLDAARRSHERLSKGADPERMIYVAGCNRPTLSGIKDFGKIRSYDGYEETMAGDGRVTHELGFLDNVPVYYVDETHGDLASNGSVLAALDDLLLRGETGTLDRRPAIARAVAGADRETLRMREEEEDREFASLLSRLRSRALTGDAGRSISVNERKAEQMITAGFLKSDSGVRRAAALEPEFSIPQIEIGVVHSGIEDIHALKRPGPPVDAISVGHYVGVRPQYAEEALDRAISAAVCGREAWQIPRDDLLITQYSDRGVLQGELGQPFFLPDPRSRDGRRLIAIAGMGLPGRCGVPELTVLVRELCWSLDRLGKRHLATVLIGSGTNNLETADAVSAWLRGIRRALLGLERPALTRITFSEWYFERAKKLDAALREAAARYQDKLKITMLDFAGRNRRVRERPPAAERAEREPAPTRLTITMSAGTYRFGAVTDTAAVPEREVAIDPALAMSANDELAAEWKLSRQEERGRFLEKLLVPKDLEQYLFTSSPLVLMLDLTTARIHWELMAQDEAGKAGTGALGGGPETFLGTCRGLTRQLRTTFAPPPEPPPPPRRMVRVLVVADPAEDAPLAGAQEEGAEVADLFETYNSIARPVTGNCVEVVRLIGPRQATRTNVLRELMLRSYDILHFAGHCVYDDKNPAASGWIFNLGKNERLAAAELRRIDRIPRFVFANACESGKTPERAEERDVRMAPSFAEAFFERGVSNFVCTAWPVDDLAARQFATELYSRLLGLTKVDAERGRWSPADPVPMYLAMRDARVAIANTGAGSRTWGAYQHYGSPHYRIFQRRRGEAALSPAVEQDAAPLRARPRRRRRHPAR